MCCICGIHACFLYSDEFSLPFSCIFSLRYRNLKLDERVVIVFFFIATLCFVEETPEFGQFFRDVSGMLKEKTGETGEYFVTADLE